MIKELAQATVLFVWLISPNLLLGKPLTVNTGLADSPSAAGNKPEARKDVDKPDKSRANNSDVFIIATIDGVKITAAEISQAIDQTTPERGAILVKRDEKLLRTFIENYINEILILKDNEVRDLAGRPDVKAKLEYAHRSTLVKAWLGDLLSRSAKKGNLLAMAEDSSRNEEFNRFKIQQLQFSDQSKAESALKRIKENPMVFDREVSLSEAPSAENGGQLGWLKKNDLPSELAKALSQLKDGEVYPEVIQTQFGFHILKLTKSQILTASDILDDYTIRQLLAERLVAKEREEKLALYRKKAKVAIFVENFSKVAP